jgi:hypothetical protein
VVRVVRTPTCRSPHQADTEPLVELYQGPHMQELMELLPTLSPKAQEILIVQARAMREREL